MNRSPVICCSFSSFYNNDFYSFHIIVYKIIINAMIVMIIGNKINATMIIDVMSQSKKSV